MAYCATIGSLGELVVSSTVGPAGQCAGVGEVKLYLATEVDSLLALDTPWSIDMAGAGAVGAAILGVWALAWGWKQLVIFLWQS